MFLRIHFFQLSFEVGEDFACLCFFFSLKTRVVGIESNP